MAKMLTRCPVCEGALKVTEMSCVACDTRIQSSFDPCKFCTLPADHLSFLEVFLRSEGNLSRVEKELGVSYPTVRNRLTSALAALGLTSDSGSEQQPALPLTPSHQADAPTPEESAARRKQALDSLARGEMGAEDVARVLRELS